MSERMGFTSNYIYDIEDYKKLRKKFEEYGNSKWMCLAPEAKWGEDEVMPLIQGKLGDISGSVLDWSLWEILEGVETNSMVRFIVTGDTFGGVYALTKNPDGTIEENFIPEEEFHTENWIISTKHKEEGIEGYIGSYNTPSKERDGLVCVHSGKIKI